MRTNLKVNPTASTLHYQVSSHYYKSVSPMWLITQAKINWLWQQINITNHQCNNHRLTGWCVYAFRVSFTWLDHFILLGRLFFLWSNDKRKGGLATRDQPYTHKIYMSNTIKKPYYLHSKQQCAHFKMTSQKYWNKILYNNKTLHNTPFMVQK